MATILEGALWTLTEAAAQRMVENGLLVECSNEHFCEPMDGVEADRPFYHIAPRAPDWFGFSTIPLAIAQAQAHVEAESTDVKVLNNVKFVELVFDPTMNPEPGGAGSITAVNDA